MSGYLYCIDNDILKKLATFNLFNDTIQLFGIGYQEVKILGTAKYKFRRDQDKLKQGRLRSSKDTFINYGKTLELAEKLPQLNQSDVLALEVYQSISSAIDPGEAILTSYVVHLLQQSTAREIFILTGDKVFLRTLVMLDIPGIQSVLRNRIWCLEQLVLMNIKEHGFESMCNKIEPVRECDVAIKAVFGSGAQSTPNNALATLQSYIDELRAETGNLLNSYPD